MIFAVAAIWQAMLPALCIDDSNAEAYALLTFIHLSMRDYDKAFEFGEKALMLGPNNSFVHGVASNVALFCNRPQEMAALLKKAMRLCPIYPAWYPYGIAICNWMLGNFTEAFKNIEEAIGIDPGLSLNYIVLAMLYMETDQTQKAVECVERVYQADPSFSATTFIDSVPFGDPEVEKRRSELFRKVGLLD